EREEGADDVEIPGCEIQARERQVARADHERNEEVSEHGGNRRDQEEENHHDAMHREELVVRVGLDEVARRRQQLEPDADGEEAAQHEHGRDRDEVEKRDPLVVDREEPRAHPVLDVQIVAPGVGLAHDPPPSALSDFTYASSRMTSSSESSP